MPTPAPVSPSLLLKHKQPARQVLSTADSGQAAELSLLTDSEDDELDTPIVKKMRKSMSSTGSRTSRCVEKWRKAEALRAPTDSEENDMEVSIFQKKPMSKPTATKQFASAGPTPTTLGGGDDARAKLRKKRTTFNTSKSKEWRTRERKDKAKLVIWLAASSTSPASSRATVPVPPSSRHE
ncbi:hypothetical protein PQX77_022331 [Marasmius sp. AFHP31]|nr:hypothetical protein PQX77_022331 [Marasmius sp. AFHP31]